MLEIFLIPNVTVLSCQLKQLLFFFFFIAGTDDFIHILGTFTPIN